MPKYKQLLSSFLGRAYKMPSDEIAELIDKTAEEELDVNVVLDAILAKHTSAITQLKERAFGEGAKKAEKTAKAAFLNQVKTNFEIDEDIADEDSLFEAIKTKFKAADGGKAQLTDDDVKKHPLFLKAEVDYKKQLKTLEAQNTEAINKVHSSYKQKEVSGKVTSKATELFVNMKPLLSKDTAKASNQVKTFVNRFGSANWEEADGEFYKLDDEGKRVEDNLGHAVSLSSLVKAEAEAEYDFVVAAPRNGAGGHHDTGGAGGGKKGEKAGDGSPKYTGKLPSTKEEYTNLMNDRTLSLDERKEVHQHWEKARAGAGAGV